MRLYLAEFFNNRCKGAGLTIVVSSFGSICFGSLIVAIIQTLRHLQNQLRHSDDDSMKLIGCIIQCILACIEDLIEYFNEWAYIYVGKLP